jgi:AMP nucleosidase
MGSPEEAVDRLVRLYDEATDALRGAVERFLKGGEPPSSAIRALFHYPGLRLTYAPSGPALSSPRAFAKFSEPGVYATTVTQPADFRAYLLEQLEPLVTEYGAAIEVGVGVQEIPYPYVIESGDELARGGADPAELARFFPVPSLATIGDETADGEFNFGPERPLALFDAPRVDYSLRRLVHYTGSDWRSMQPWVLLTNYHRYVDQFVQWGLKQLRGGTGVEKVILPGNVVIDSSIAPAEAEARVSAVAWHRFPDARLPLRARRRAGDQPGQHRRWALERQDHHRPHRGLEAALLADDRPLRGFAAIAGDRRLRARARLSQA